MGAAHVVPAASFSRRLDAERRATQALVVGRN